jgi:hypothetical protein
MKPLNELFTEEDVLVIVQAAVGRLVHPTDMEVSLETFKRDEIMDMPDYVKLPFIMENGDIGQRLVATINFDREIVIIAEDGDVSSQNMSECRFRLHDAVAVYERVLRCMKPELFKDNEWTCCKCQTKYTFREQPAHVMRASVFEGDTPEELPLCVHCYKPKEKADERHD